MILRKQNQDLNFIVLTSHTLLYVGVFFAILIFKSVSQAIFNMQLVYFVWKLARLIKKLFL